MLCAKCGLRPATTGVLCEYGGRVEKVYLCEACAREYRQDTGFGDFVESFFNASPMVLLTGFPGLHNASGANTLVCPDCHTTSAEFLKSGFVGCAKCYEVFEPLVKKAVRQFQKSDRHVGKQPYESKDDAATIEQIRAEIQEAFDNENYERVTALSSKLNKLRGGDN